MHLLAGWAVLVAIPVVVAAAVALALFFAGRGRAFGPVNDVATAVLLLLLVPAVLAVRDITSGRIGAFITGGVGFAPVVAWIGALAVVGFAGIVDVSVAWWSLGFVLIVEAAAVVATLIKANPFRLTLALGAPLTVGLTGWLLALARDLLGRG